MQRRFNGVASAVLQQARPGVAMLNLICELWHIWSGGRGSTQLHQAHEDGDVAQAEDGGRHGVRPQPPG